MVTSLATAKTVPLSLCTFTALCAGAEVTTGSLSLFFTSQLQYYNKIHYYCLLLKVRRYIIDSRDIHMQLHRGEEER